MSCFSKWLEETRFGRSGVSRLTGTTSILKIEEGMCVKRLGSMKIHFN